MNVKFLRVDVLVCCVLFTTLGGIAGWHLNISLRSDHSGEGQQSDDHDHDHDDHSDDKQPGLSAVTLRTLGVKVGAIQKSDFQQYRAVPAVVTKTYSTDQPVHAPIGGRVLKILVKEGALVKAGQHLLTLARDPIPRPQLMLTADFLKPATEEFHRAVSQFRKTREEIKIIQTELDRVRKFTDNKGGKQVAVLPLKTIIDLQYGLKRAQKSYKLARLELTKHGFDDEQIKRIVTNESVRNWGEGIWKRALEQNGMWNKRSEALYQTLPELVRGRPWVVATIGELTVSDLNDAELVPWFKAEPKVCHSFLEVASLLQMGHSVADIKLLYQMNAFKPIIKVRAPQIAGIKDYDIDELLVKRGAKVSAGLPLLTLANPQRLYLRTEPVGGEKADILRAVKDRSLCRAAPLIPDTGPTLSDLKITYVTNASNGQGTVAFININNEPLVITKDNTNYQYRSWKLRAGLKYSLLIPTRTMRNVFVLPSAAIATDGPNNIVFVKEGDSFKTVKVQIVYQDHKSAVIPVSEDCPISAGDIVVQSGAFALGLALKAGSSKVDPHAGHNH
jgi:hypothetical protein